MDVPFVQSGALNRAHYALVKSVESAPSPEIADSFILKEVKSIQHRLRHPRLSLNETKECLIILFLDFALAQAVNLAEAGKKDLESPTTAPICLALDNLITSPSEDVIPAVQSRLHDLLSNPSPHVRRRALLACSALSRYAPDLLRRVTSKVLKRLRDEYPEVVGAALTVSLKLFKLHEPARNGIKEAVNTLLQWSWSNHHEQPVRWILLQILRTLGHVGILPAVMYAAFLLLLNVDAREISNAQTSQSLSPAVNIRDLLISRSVNDQYIFLACLGCLSPEMWAGTNAEIPAVLEEWEVGRVMEFLDSTDTVIRQKTLRILNSIDPNIVTSYYSQSLQTLPPDLNLKGISEYTTRLLEVIELQTEGDGELYAGQLAELFTQMEARSPRYAQLVVESAVEMVLFHLRNAPMPFRIGCVTTLVTSLANGENFLGHTMMIIVSALATEYAGKLAVPPPDVLRGLSARLPLCSLAVQDACLLTMLRISAECEQVPSEVLIGIRDLGNQSRRHIRQRCEDFTTLSTQKDVLGDIIQRAHSSSLPDFLEALHRYKVQSSPKKTPDTADEPSSPSSSRESPSANKLRYTAYDAPPPAPRLRDRAFSGGSSRSNSSASSQLSADELSRTVTAGDLTLAAAAQEFEMEELSPHAAASAAPVEILVIPAECFRQSPQAADLIAFNDSPFISDPATDFESIWNDLDESRGARLESLEDTLNVISVEELPFVGKSRVRGRRC
ncbi:armadillo-type protein [Mycena galopus ATCC 62051]|nr:armadillo-type protein [Mycena galopus ATCC 62051]